MRNWSGLLCEFWLLNLKAPIPQNMVKHTQTIRGQQPTNCLSVFDHFVKLALYLNNFLKYYRFGHYSCTKLVYIDFWVKLTLDKKQVYLARSNKSLRKSSFKENRIEEENMILANFAVLSVFLEYCSLGYKRLFLQNLQS